MKLGGSILRKLGIAEIEDIALGAALLGAGGGGDPYVGKLVAIGAVKGVRPCNPFRPRRSTGRRPGGSHRHDGRTYGSVGKGHRRNGIPDTL